MTRPLEYIGPVIDQNTSVSYRAYVTSRMSENLTSTEIDNTITNALSSYTTSSYVDTRDSLNATQSYIQAQDNLRVKLAQKDVNNGVPSLGSTGRVNASRIQNNSTQRWPRGFWSPSSYFASPVILSTSTETQVYTTSVTDPGFPFKLMVFGAVDGLTAADGLYPVVRVRVGSGVSGPIVAQGRGIGDSYNYWGIDSFNRTTSGNAGGSSYFNEFIRRGSAGNVQCDGNNLVYQQSGTGQRDIFLQRSGVLATTVDDWQEISVVVSYSCEQTDAGVEDRQAFNRIYGRVSPDRSSYICFESRGDNLLGPSSSIRLYICNGTESQITDVPGNEWQSGHTITARWGTSSGKRFYQYLDNGASIINYSDSGNVAAMGSNNRGWGLGFGAGQNLSFGVPVSQSNPAELAQVTINDLQPGTDASSYGPIDLQPINIHSQSVLTGAQTLTVTMNRSSTVGPVGLYPLRPDLYVVAIPA